MPTGRVATAVLSVAVVGCASPAPETAEALDPAVVRNEIDSTLAAHTADLESGDVGKVASIYAEDVVSRVAGMAPIRGRAAMQEFIAGFFAGFSIDEAEYATDELSVDGDTAWVFGTYRWVVRPAGGGDPVTDRGNQLTKWVRGPDGVWKIHRNIGNSVGSRP